MYMLLLYFSIGSILSVYVYGVPLHLSVNSIVSDCVCQLPLYLSIDFFRRREWGGSGATLPVWRSEGILLELVLSFPRVGPRD